MVSSSDLTLAFIGCGNMGSAILSGILDASTAISSPVSRILACTKTQSSAEKLDARFREHGSPLTVGFFAGKNTAAAEDADVIILGCKPYLVDAVLAEEGLADALAGKIVVSIIAGKTIDVLSEGISRNQTEYKSSPSDKAVIVRAIPNVAASVRESMTVIELPTPSPSNDQKDLITWIFSQIGQTSFLSSDLFDCGTMLMASIATVSVAVDGILDGCVAEGMKRADASEMTAQCLLGLARLLRERTSSSCTKGEYFVAAGLYNPGTVGCGEGWCKECVCRECDSRDGTSEEITGEGVIPRCARESEDSENRAWILT